jgi:hypothetical protein
MNANLEALAEQMGIAGEWEDRNGSLWLSPEALDVRRMATVMNTSDARLVTITAIELPEGEGIRLDYHWDLDGTLATVITKAENGSAASIYDLCPAADWIEREIHEYFAIEFAGRQCDPLFLRAGAAPGINLHKEDE